MDKYLSIFQNSVMDLEINSETCIFEWNKKGLYFVFFMFLFTSHYAHNDIKYSVRMLCAMSFDTEESAFPGT